MANPREVAMPQDRHPVERIQRENALACTSPFKIVEGVGRVLVGKDQPDDVDVGASREAVDDGVEHLFSLPVR